MAIISVDDNNQAIRMYIGFELKENEYGEEYIKVVSNLPMESIREALPKIYKRIIEVDKTLLEEKELAADIGVQMTWFQFVEKIAWSKMGLPTLAFAFPDYLRNQLKDEFLVATYLKVLSKMKNQKNKVYTQAKTPGSLYALHHEFYKLKTFYPSKFNLKYKAMAPENIYQYMTSEIAEEVIDLIQDNKGDLEFYTGYDWNLNRGVWAINKETHLLEFFYAI